MAKHWVALSAVALLLASSAAAQLATSTTSTPPATTQTSDPQAVVLANQAQLALTGGTVVSDAQLNATSDWIAGSTRASGTATLKTKGTSEARLDIGGGSVSRSEIRNDSNGPDGQWVGPDGARHPIALHNCWVPAAWFAPHAIVQALSSTDAVLRYVGNENRGGISVDHLRAYRNYSTNSPQIDATIPSLSTFDLYLDSTTHLPIALSYNTHPDRNANRNIAIEVRFADYRAVNGVSVPFRIQRLMQGVLNLDLTVTSAAVNSGVADSDFALQ